MFLGKKKLRDKQLNICRKGKNKSQISTKKPKGALKYSSSLTEALKKKPIFAKR